MRNIRSLFYGIAARPVKYKKFISLITWVSLLHWMTLAFGNIFLLFNGARIAYGVVVRLKEH